MSQIKNILSEEGLLPKTALPTKTSGEDPPGLRRAFNKYDPNELLAALVGLLEKHDLRDVAKRLKALTPEIQDAWRNRED